MNIINEIQVTSSFYNEDIYKNHDEVITFNEFMEKFYGEEITSRIVECMVIIKPISDDTVHASYDSDNEVDYLMLVYLDDGIKKILRVNVTDKECKMHRDAMFGHIYDIASGSSYSIV